MGQDRSHHAIAQQSELPLVHQPFRELRQALRTRPAAQRTSAKPAPIETAKPVHVGTGNGETLFLDAMAGVTPLEAGVRQRVDHPAPATQGRPVTPSDAEALAELCDLVTGNLPFDIADTYEYIEGSMVGLDPRLLRRLRAGEFAYQAHLDLHGMTTEEARPAVEAFLLQAHQQGKRCVLIVHGRGRNSKDQIPVLKSRLTDWLARGAAARLVLAFTSARPCDGGVGALYVLLRKRRQRKRPIRVTNGAKW